MDISDFPFSDILADAAGRRVIVRLSYPEHGEGGITDYMVEPYSYRSLGGNLVFYGYDTSAGHIKAFRLDKIQNVQVTEEPYEPRWTIELG